MQECWLLGITAHMMAPSVSQSTSNDTGFTLGDIVLAKYSKYPLWPGTITPCFQRKHHGKFSVGAGPNTKFWVQFFNENSAAWVSQSKIVSFDPETALSHLASEGSKWFDSQNKAFQLALDDHARLQGGSKPKGNNDQTGNGRSEAGDTVGETDSDSDSDEKDAPNEGGEEDEEEGEDEEEDENKGVRESGSRSSKTKSGGDEGKPGTASKTKNLSKSRSSAQEAKSTTGRAQGKNPSGMSNRAQQRSPKRKSAAGSHATADEGKRSEGSRARRRKKADPEDSGQVRRLEEQLSAREEEISQLESRISDLKAKVKALQNPAKPEFVCPALPPQPAARIPPRSVHGTVETTKSDLARLGDELRRVFSRYEAQCAEAAEADDAFESAREKAEEKLRKLFDSVDESSRTVAAEEEATGKLLEQLLFARVSSAVSPEPTLHRLVLRINRRCRESSSLLVKASKAILDCWNPLLAESAARKENDKGSSKRQDGIANATVRDSASRDSDRDEKTGIATGNAEGKDEKGPSDEPSEGHSRKRTRDAEGSDPTASASPTAKRQRSAASPASEDCPTGPMPTDDEKQDAPDAEDMETDAPANTDSQDGNGADQKGRSGVHVEKASPSLDSPSAPDPETVDDACESSPGCATPDEPAELQDGDAGADSPDENSTRPKSIAAAGSQNGNKASSPMEVETRPTVDSEPAQKNDNLEPAQTSGIDG